MTTVTVNGLSLKQRNIQINFILNYGKVFQGKYNAKTVTANDMTARVTKQGGKAKDTADVVVYGMPIDDIAQLTTLNYKTLELSKNKIEIYAGYDDNLSLIFLGDIIEAWGDFSDVNRPLKIKAQTGFYANASALKPISAKGMVSASNIFETIAKQAGFTFVNNGVNKQISNPVLTGGSVDQIQMLASRIGVTAKVDSNVLTIYGSEAKTGVIPLLNRHSGLINYPKINQHGVEFECYYNSSIKWNSCVELDTISPRCSGIWQVYYIEYNLTNNEEEFIMHVKASPRGTLV